MSLGPPTKVCSRRDHESHKTTGDDEDDMDEEVRMERDREKDGHGERGSEESASSLLGSHKCHAPVGAQSVRVGKPTAHVHWSRPT